MITGRPKCVASGLRHSTRVAIRWCDWCGYVPSEVSELILVGHHCICDGQTGLTLLRECLSAYDEPGQDLGSYDTLGAIEDLVPAELLIDRSFRRRMRWKIAMFRMILFGSEAGDREQPAHPQRADVLPSLESRYGQPLRR